MDRIPVEVADKIFSFLNKRSIKCLRLACKDLAGIGESHLFANWQYRLIPRTSSLSQLAAISQHPTIPRYLEVLICETGVLSEIEEYRIWKAGIAQERHNAWNMENNTSWNSDSSRERSLEFQNDLEAGFPSGMEESFHLLRKHLDSEAFAMTDKPARDELLTLMRHVRPSKEIKITMVGIDLSLEELQKFHRHPHLFKIQERPSKGLDNKASLIRARRAACLIHYLHYLQGASTCPLDSIKLVADGLPVELLNTIYDRLLSDISFYGLGRSISTEDQTYLTAFQTASNMDIYFTHLPHSVFLSPLDEVEARNQTQTNAMRIRRLYSAQQRTQGIQSRRIAAGRFASYLSHNQCIEKLSISFTSTFQMMGLSSAFLGLASDSTHGPLSCLAQLVSLSIDRIEYSEEEGRFNLSVIPQVRHLTMRNGEFSHGTSMIDLLHRLREKENLEYVCIEGVWCRKVVRPYERWMIYNPENFTERNMFDGPYPLHGLRYEIEQYILHGGPCPLPSLAENPRCHEQWELLSDASWQYQDLHH